jgi:hypothetical protein
MVLQSPKVRHPSPNRINPLDHPELSSALCRGGRRVGRNSLGSKGTRREIQKGPRHSERDFGRIATGDVRAVPAGLYAKAALEKLGISRRLAAVQQP